MTAWRLAKLGSLAEFKNGLNFSAESWGRGLKIIGVADFGDRIFPDYQRLDEINPSGVAREQDMLEEDDILFVRSNGNRQLIGRCMHIRGLSEPVSHSGFTIRLRFKGGCRVHVPFFVYLFRSDLIRQVLSDFGGGTNINNLNQGILENLNVPVPDLDEQRKIAAILSAYDDLIANNQRRIALLEGMAEEIYREWFVRMRFPGWKTAKFRQGIPERWTVMPLEALFRTASGGTPSRTESENFGGDVAWVKTGELKSMFVNSTEETISTRGLESSSAKVLPKNTVVMAMYCAMPDVAILGIEAATNQACCALLPKREAIGHQWTYFFARSALGHLVNFAHGAAQQNLSQEIIRRFRILYPGDELVEQYCDRTKALFAQIQLLSDLIGDLVQARDALLPRLISGKLKVDHLDIRLPPSMRAEAEAVA